MQKNPNTSLWDRLPKSATRELIPILTTGFLSQSGELTASLLIRFRNGTPWSQQPHAQAVNDLTGIFILLNFVVIFWFGYVTLAEAVQKDTQVSLNAKLVGLGSAFVTSLDLYRYALKSGEPERLVYALAVMFYVFVIPFFFTRRLRPSSRGQASGGEPAAHGLAAYELVVYALVLCVITTLACSLYFVILNDGAVVAGHPLLRAVVPQISHLGRTEFWGISPGILGIGWLAVTSASSTAHNAAGHVYGPDARGRLYILLGAFAVSILIAVIMIDDTSVAPTQTARTLGWWPMAGIKALMAVAATGAFMLAFYACRTVGKRLKLPASAAIPIGLAAFAFAGLVFGGALALLRTQMGDMAQPNLHLLWMHACGFALAFVSGCIGMSTLRKPLGDVLPPMEILPWADRSGEKHAHR